MLLVPVVLVLTVLRTPLSLAWALGFFLICALTDILDGHVARKHSLQSDFGAYWDPLADKILTLGLFTVLIFHPGLRVYWWLVAMLYIRDIGVTLIRNVFKKNGWSFRTTILAKIKTVIQMVVLGLILVLILIPAWRLPASRLDYTEAWYQLAPGYPWMALLPLLLTTLTVFITLLSSIEYISGYYRSVKKEV